LRYLLYTVTTVDLEKPVVQQFSSGSDAANPYIILQISRTSSVGIPTVVSPLFPRFSNTPTNKPSQRGTPQPLISKTIIKMRFSTTALLALPLLASAAESPFEQYKAKFQNFLSSFGASAPGGTADKAAEAAPSVATSKGGAKTKNVVEPKKIETLTLENWKDTLLQGQQAEEWLVLLSGRNKTCFGSFAPSYLSISRRLMYKT
jgi:hypothetical protein